MAKEYFLIKILVILQKKSILGETCTKQCSCFSGFWIASLTALIKCFMAFIIWITSSNNFQQEITMKNKASVKNKCGRRKHVIRNKEARWKLLVPAANERATYSNVLLPNQKMDGLKRCLQLFLERPVYHQNFKFYRHVRTATRTFVISSWDSQHWNFKA